MDRLSLNALVEKTKKLKLLFVEDHENTRQQALKIFSSFFDNIDVAVNGYDGLEKYKSAIVPYDLVISDINMVKMNGVEMSKAILALNPQQKILIVSAYNDSEQLMEVMCIGVSNFIHKPINLTTFISELQKIILIIEREEKERKDFEEIRMLNHELGALIKSFNTYVIATRTDLKGNITYVSRAFEAISGYTEAELIGKPQNIVRHPDMPATLFKELWMTIKAQTLWVGEIKNRKKYGGSYWVKAHVSPYYDSNGTHIGYSSIRTDITARKELEKLHTEVSSLLNNAGQGFLSFDKNMNIRDGFSKECINIFGFEDLANKNIADILFVNDKAKYKLFEDGIKSALDTDEAMIKEIFLSLLPAERLINDKNISIEYKALENDIFMLILTDITKTKLLEHKLIEQNQIQKMIVAVASNQKDFIELKIDFEKFIANPSSDLSTLLRELHTFKGVFAQKEMLNISNAIHELESKINSTKQNGVELVNEYGLQNIFNKDLEIITSTLGEEFLSTTRKLSINRQDLYILESKVKALESKEMHSKLTDILHDFEVLKYEPVYNMLTMYPSAVKQRAQKFQKEIYPLEIDGDKNLVVTPKLKPFMKSLIHLFNNCVDHGIEDIETRIENKKDEIGKITCQFSKKDNSLQIVISDDGAGIDIEKLNTQAESKGITIDGEKTMLVFVDSLSTKEKVTITSGRGLGMSAIKNELSKLGGNIEIKNNIGFGVEFSFTLPL